MVVCIEGGETLRDHVTLLYFDPLCWVYVYSVKFLVVKC